ncbi:MAG: chemotaxis protein CheD, partial [Pseudomonadota bacterium]
EGIAIAGKDLGGTSARRLKFHAARGEVNNMIVPATPDIEPAAPRRHAAAASEKPDITLF